MTSPQAFLGLTYNPFAKQGFPVKDCFHSHDFDEMTGGLSHVTKARGIAVFTSPPGNGKTLVVRAFSHGINKNLGRMSYVCLSTVSITEFQNFMR